MKTARTALLRAATLALAWVLLPLVAACATLGLEAPRTFNERAALAYTTAATTRTIALQALQAKRIGPDDARHVQDLADQVRVGVDAARRLASTGVGTGANDRLRLAEGILRELTAYLASRGVKAP